MNVSTIEVLASTWAQISEEAEFLSDYEGTASPEARRACEVIQERIREGIVAIGELCLFGLQYLLSADYRRYWQSYQLYCQTTIFYYPICFSRLEIRPPRPYY